MAKLRTVVPPMKPCTSSTYAYSQRNISVEGKLRTVAIAQARMGSTRLPGKVMFQLAGKPVLQWTVDAIKAADGIDEVVVATSTLPQDDMIAQYCAMNRINCFRGSENDVLDR